jgi:hypothetical protein
MNDNDIDHLCKMLKQSHDTACKASGFTDTMFLQALEGVIHLRQQRDEARQEICIQKCDSLGAVIGGSPATPQDYAEERGWDCFKNLSEIS